KLGPIWLLVAISACGRAPEPEKPKEPIVTLVAVDWSALPGWLSDDPSPALVAFRRSCSSLPRRDAGAHMGRPGGSGKVRDWLPVCQAAAGIGSDAPAARQFFEASFVPFAVMSDGKAEGLFTGYYEPLLNGSRSPDGRYRVPLHGRPADLVSVDL